MAAGTGARNRRSRKRIPKGQEQRMRNDRVTASANQLLLQDLAHTHGHEDPIHPTTRKESKLRAPRSQTQAVNPLQTVVSTQLVID
jgi:hypothetical protein